MVSLGIASAGGCYQAVAQGEETRSDPGGLPEFRRHSWEFGEVKVTRVCWAEYQRGETCRETEL